MLTSKEISKRTIVAFLVLSCSLLLLEGSMLGLATWAASHSVSTQPEVVKALLSIPGTPLLPFVVIELILLYGIWKNKPIALGIRLVLSSLLSVFFLLLAFKSVVMFLFSLFELSRAVFSYQCLKAAKRRDSATAELSDAE